MLATHISCWYFLLISFLTSTIIIFLYCLSFQHFFTGAIVAVQFLKISKYTLKPDKNCFRCINVVIYTTTACTNIYYMNDIRLLRLSMGDDFHNPAIIQQEPSVQLWLYDQLTKCIYVLVLKTSLIYQVKISLKSLLMLQNIRNPRFYSTTILLSLTCNHNVFCRKI